MEQRRAQGLVANDPVTKALASLRLAYFGVAFISLVVNLLALTGSFYMLQVYDRVLAGRSVPTLVALSVICLGLFALQALLDMVRARILSRLAQKVERAMLIPVHQLQIVLPRHGLKPEDIGQPMRDIEAIRGFLSGQGIIAFFDLPWMPIFLAVIYLLHPALAGIALAGLVVLVAITFATEMLMRNPVRESAANAAKRLTIAETVRRNADVITAMGFEDRAGTRFLKASGAAGQAIQKSSDIAADFGALSRSFRMVLQSAVLGLGAYLVLQNQMSAGAIIAATILAGRAFAPIDLVIGTFRQFTAARQARLRLTRLFQALPNEEARFGLELPNRSVEVKALTVPPPGGRRPLIRDVSFTLAAGDALAVVGPSGAGKSTLIRALVGAATPSNGLVNFDGAPLAHFPRASIGRIIGYLPQEIELFDASISENIARLDEEADEKDVISAAKAASLHEFILSLPHGYKTVISEGGTMLSIGQRQRVALARALYGDPFLVVLDEPNAHLDGEGEQALLRAIRAIRARGGIAIIAAHRQAVLEVVSHIAVIRDGALQQFGARDAILKQQAPRGVKDADPVHQDKPALPNVAAFPRPISPFPARKPDVK